MVADRAKNWWAKMPGYLKVLVLVAGVSGTLYGAGVTTSKAVADQRGLPDRVKALEEDTTRALRSDLDSLRSDMDSLRTILVPISCFTKANAKLPGYTRDGCALSPKP